VTPEEQLCAAPLDIRPDPVPTTERRRLSAIRIVGAIGSVVLVAGLVVVLRGGATPAVTAQLRGFAPYVDVTATPTYAFEDAAGTGSTDLVLGFVVSSKDAACEPSWGGAYSLDEAAGQLDLDRRVARVAQVGGRIAVSFGGAANSELAIGCTDETALAAAYRSVVERYSLDTIDLDIEGSMASAASVVQRRASAIAEVVASERAAGRRLDVWLTLPVSTTGLTAEGLAVLQDTLAAGVDPAGVNAMVMDFGEPIPAGDTMADQAERALTALQAQVRTAYAAAGTTLSDDEAWQRVGATPMIGQNDVAGEVFDLDDARQLVAFARARQLRQISMWSANRDQDCGPNYPDVQVVSDQCSGVEQTTGGFAAVFRRFAGSTKAGSDAGSATPTATPASAAPAPTGVGESDDPASSPYEIWNAVKGYPTGTKVVWHHNVYVAKWYSIAERPDAPVTDTYLTPWTLVGPVLPGEHPAVVPTLPAGTYPEWRAGRVYEGGDRVLLDGVGYQAKWWTQGDPPDAPVQTPYDSPWLQLSGRVSPGR
jgi:chitinase